jgi:predicted sulfurtransferase
MTLKPARRLVREVEAIAKGRRLDGRVVIRREEFNGLIDLLNERSETLNALVRNQDIQFQRIAQLQAEVDLLKQPKLKKT